MKTTSQNKFVLVPEFNVNDELHLAYLHEKFGNNVKFISATDQQATKYQKFLNASNYTLYPFGKLTYPGKPSNNNKFANPMKYR